jgi:hypothetical protein
LVRQERLYQSIGAKGATLEIPSNDPESNIINVLLNGLAILKGDVNGDGYTNLQDAILALQITCGLDPITIRSDYAVSDTDVDKDNKIGLPEVICILQTAAGIRSSW